MYLQENGSAEGIADCGVAIRPLNRYLRECGDTGKIYRGCDACELALIDVLGHGAEAHEVAILAETYLDQYHGIPLPDLIAGLHNALAGTRGAVGAVCRYCPETGILRCTGIGNITVRVFGGKQERLVLRDGILGYQTIRPHIVETTLRQGDILLMHSDGIKSSIDFLHHPGLLGEDAQTIADRVLHIYGTKTDDASCIVMKC